MLNFSKVLDIKDYLKFTEHLAIAPVIAKLNHTYRYEHEHRKWEYGMALRYLLQNDIKTVLDVGGGGSILAPMLSIYGFEVTQLDLDSGEKEVEYQNQFLENKIKFIYGDFSEDLALDKYDAVVSISVIEHVKKDRLFFSNLLKHARKIVFITTDFHPSGKAFSDAHLRTYNSNSIYDLVSNVEFPFIFTDYDPKYSYKGNFVYEYSFASIALEHI